VCGIAGFSLLNHPEGNEASLVKMGNAIYHRGPDAGGTYIDDSVGLCHRRLSIIDLSEAGNQPMFSGCGNYVIVFNGEIYNFLELRETLEQEGVVFNSHSDTEVILALYKKEGVECIHRLNGMFAFALWDKQQGQLFIARDRLGKKPLYYFSKDGRFAFASEIKALLTLENIPRKIRLDAVYDFFAYQYVPDPKSIFEDIHKLPPAHYMLVTKDGIKQRQYWDLSFTHTSSDSIEDNKDKLLSLLNETTRQRMISDVPLGAFLSGGVDSSGVVALMANNSDKPVKTCTIGFDNKKYNEAEFAKEIAQKYNTEHHEFTVHQNVADRLEEIAQYFDEPFADPSLVPTFFVSELARKEVTVAIAGDGGDEMFAGYEKYAIDDIEKKLRDKFPKKVREKLFPPLAKLAGTIPLNIAKRAKSLLNSLSQSPAMGFYITNSQMTDETWSKLVKPDVARALGNYHPSRITLDKYEEADGPDHLSKLLYTDIKTYLTGGILVKVDRMSMANHLEVRAPLLDYQIAEFAASIPSEQKFNEGIKKRILKEALVPFIPTDLLHRKKMGFSVPLAQWFRGELKLLSEKFIVNADYGVFEYLEKSEVMKLWHEHQSSKHDHGSILWSILMFQMWFNRYIPQSESIQ
tara:strand:+ start:19828 stop:21726 length:1899 start_codon:yes stop_codon:yes gene_type:complete